jgi:hypothetical protein
VKCPSSSSLVGREASGEPGFWLKCGGMKTGQAGVKSLHDTEIPASCGQKRVENSHIISVCNSKGRRLLSTGNRSETKAEGDGNFP